MVERSDRRRSARAQRRAATTGATGIGDRALDTRLGTLNLAGAEAAAGQLTSSAASSSAARPPERPWSPSFKEGWIGGVSTRRVDELVRRWG